MTYNNKLHLLWITCHLFVAYFFLTNFVLLYLILGYAWYVFIKGVGSEIGAHRYFTHQSFITSKLKEKFLIWVQTLCGEGSVLTFVGVHRMHHAFTDTEKDPHSPYFKSWVSIAYFLQPITLTLNIVKDVTKNWHIKKQHKYYFHIHFCLLIIGFFYPIFYCYFIAFPILLSLYTNAIVNIALHKYGEKVDNSSSARNNFFINLALYGAGYHGNHHKNARDYKFNQFAVLDILGFVIEKVFLVKQSLDKKL